MDLERTLKRLFDYQKFEKNADLERLVDSVHSRYAIRELSIDDVDMVFAAGVPGQPPRDRKKEHKKNVVSGHGTDLPGIS